MVEPTIAAVRPRVVVGGDRGVVLLEDLVPEMAASGQVRSIELLGPAGFGTTTALRHIAAVLGPDAGFDFVDTEVTGGFVRQKVTGKIDFPKATLHRNPVVLQFKLAEWGRDEWIEYLLAVHKSQCGSVMSRVLNDKEMRSLEGNPSILTLVLDEFAADDRLSNVKSALQQIVERNFPSEGVLADMRDVVRSLVLFMYRDDLLDIRKLLAAEMSAVNKKLTDEQIRLFGARVVQFYFLTEVAWHDLVKQTPSEFFHSRWPRRLISSVAARLVESPTIQKVLQDWIMSDDLELQPMSVSLLHAAGADWELPEPKTSGIESKRINLNRVILDRADCTGKPLAGCSMENASLQHVNLTNADLTDVSAKESNFHQADFRNADLTRFEGHYARFVGANLSGSHGRHILLGNADLSRANLSNAKFENSNFENANLYQCDFKNSRLTSCDFQGANLEEADFTGSDLAQSILIGLDLTAAEFFKAKFHEARLNNCNLEGMELPAAAFYGASLEGAEMTGSIMPHADFYGADLRFAKLAEIEWECADLRFADLTGATFHMGSSRSGLVDSSIPMEGSRTGFYTDELNEQDFKAPEEIRKANLRAADLRGAIIKGVDFYLVDLRDANYDASQVEQLRRTGAILESREC